MIRTVPFNQKIAMFEASQSLRNSFQAKWENFEGPSSHLSLTKQVEYDFLNKPQMYTRHTLLRIQL